MDWKPVPMMSKQQKHDNCDGGWFSPWRVTSKESFKCRAEGQVRSHGGVRVEVPDFQCPMFCELS